MLSPFTQEETEFCTILKVINCPSQLTYNVRVRLLESCLLRVQAFTADQNFSLDLKASHVPNHDPQASLLWLKLLIESAYSNGSLKLFYIDTDEVRLKSPFATQAIAVFEECREIGAICLLAEYQMDEVTHTVSLQLPLILEPIWSISKPLSPKSQELISLYFQKHQLQATRSNQPGSASIQTEILRLTSLLN